MSTTLIKDIYPNKAQFLVDEPIEIIIEYNQNDKEIRSGILSISHLDQPIMLKQLITMQSFNNQEVMEFKPFKRGGYGVDLMIYDEDGHIIERYSTAFDVNRSHKEAPRYGFLSDFSTSDLQDNEDITMMKKLHLNMVQYYDWMYRHDDLVCDHDSYTDLMGKETNLNTVKEKIRLCHESGMKAIAYGAIYAASREFYNEHKDWGLMDSAHQPITFIDIFYIMNIQEECPWHRHIIEEYAKAIDNVGFDGIHMDTYGFPKKGISVYENKYEVVHLDKEFPILINNTRNTLETLGKDITLVFNNVGNWPVNRTAFAQQDVIYVEVWDPYKTYNHIKAIIVDAKQYANKPVILAAYLKPFRMDCYEKAGYALKLLTAAIVAHGGSHLILGENQGVLTQGYYVDYSMLDDTLFHEIRGYYDFIVRYKELFYDDTLIDVSMTHIYGDNQEYIFEGTACSATAEPDCLWTIVKENECRKVISLINLLGNDVLWNEGKNKPLPIEEVTIEVQIEKNIQSVYKTSPERIQLTEVPYEIIKEERGKVLKFSLQDLDSWTVIVINS